MMSGVKGPSKPTRARALVLFGLFAVLTLQNGVHSFQVRSVSLTSHPKTTSLSKKVSCCPLYASSAVPGPEESFSSSSGPADVRIQQAAASSSQGPKTAKKAADIDSAPSIVPSYREIMVFVLTTILIWVSEPLLSLVDTTVVGQRASNAVVQLAALGPATMLIDNLAFLTYFLSMATTNLVAQARAKGDIRKLQVTSSQVLGVAGCLGAVITAVVFGAGRPLLRWTAGASATPELLRLSLAYSRIRSIASPLAIMGLVAQSICMACLDTRTPFLAVLAASFVNVVGDLYLVGTRNMGIQGAAIATAAASVTSTAVLMVSVFRKMKEWREAETTNGTTNGASSTAADIAKVIDGSPHLLMQNATKTTTAASTTTKKKKRKHVPLVSFPDRASLLKLIPLAGPMFFVIVAKIICYSSLTVRATDFGVTVLAAHNVMMSVFFFYTCFGDSLNMTSQTFLPNVLIKTKRKKNDPNKVAVKMLMRRLLTMAVGIGLFDFGISQWILRNLSGYFTKEAAISSLMSQNATFMGLALLLHPFIMLFEGSIIATHDFPFLVRNYTMTMGLLFVLLKVAATSFPGVWKALFIFQGIRLAQFSTRVWRRTVQSSNGDDPMTASNTRASPAST